MTEVVLVEDERVTIVHEKHTTVIETDEPDTVIVEIGNFDVEVLSPSSSVEVNTAGIQGPPGPPGAGGRMYADAIENIMAFSAVAVDSAGKAYRPDKDTLADASLVVGVAANAALIGEQVEIVTDGPLETSTTWTLGPLFLGSDGVLVSVPSGAFQLQVAVALTASTLLVRPQFPIFAA